MNLSQLSVVSFAFFLSACGQEVFKSELIQGPKGEQGERGIDGLSGSNGADGASCQVTSVPVDVLTPNGGALITCGTTSVLLVNGAPGADGTDGQDGQDGADAPQTPYSITEVIDPCGASGGQDEVLLKFANGTLVASFSDNGSALTTRLSILKAGSNYRTTDNDNCYFSVDSSGNIFNEHH